MYLSVDKFTTARTASLLEQAKDAISAIKKNKHQCLRKKAKPQNDYHRTNQYDEKSTLAFKRIKLHRISGRRE